MEQHSQTERVEWFERRQRLNGDYTWFRIMAVRKAQAWVFFEKEAGERGWFSLPSSQGLERRAWNERRKRRTWNRAREEYRRSLASATGGVDVHGERHPGSPVRPPFGRRRKERPWMASSTGALPSQVGRLPRSGLPGRRIGGPARREKRPRSPDDGEGDSPEGGRAMRPDRPLAIEQTLGLLHISPGQN
mgnify:CR=1 FL=1